jgi:signal transduction histidine kinase
VRQTGQGSRARSARAFRVLRRRIALSHGLVLALIVVALGSVAYWLTARELDQTATVAVVSAAQTEADRIIDAGKAEAAADEDRPSAAAIRVAVYGPDGRPLAEARGVPGWLRPRAAPVVTISILGERVRLATAKATSGGVPLGTVVTAQSLAPEDRLLARFRLLLGVGGLAAVALSMAAGWVLAGRAARPVRRAYEAQAGFAADAAHELRTPLASVRIGVEALAERDSELGREVLEEVDYLTSLTNRLLALARADVGSAGARGQPVDVALVCRHAVRRGEGTLALRVGVDPDPAGSPIARGDPLSLEAALDAVLENVARHGGGEAVVSCRVSGDRVRISVADHGPGMSPDHRARAFDRFFRADQARTHTGSVGLGLSLARSLVESQGGRMWLTETQGGGVTTVIDLPIDAGRDTER